MRCRCLGATGGDPQDSGRGLNVLGPHDEDLPCLSTEAQQVDYSGRDLLVGVGTPDGQQLPARSQQWQAPRRQPSNPGHSSGRHNIGAQASHLLGPTLSDGDVG